MPSRLVLVLTVMLLAGQAIPAAAGAYDCSVVYDEFDSLMNKGFLLKPEGYVPVERDKLSRADYEAKQRDRLLLGAGRRGAGVAIVRTNANTYGKFLFAWEGPGDARGVPLLVLRDVTLYGKVQDGSARRVTREIRLSASQKADLDRGLPTEGPEADIWFHNVDGKTIYLEAVNGAQIAFPMGSLCK